MFIIGESVKMTDEDIFLFSENEQYDKVLFHRSS